MYVVISIVVAIVVVIYFFMKKSKNENSDTLKLKVQRDFKDYFIEGLTDVKSNPEKYEAFTQTIEEKLAKIHQDYGITLAPMIEMSDGFNPDVDISKLKFRWASCPEDSTVMSCFRSLLPTRG